jgi:hypothetical protein
MASILSTIFSSITVLALTILGAWEMSKRPKKIDRKLRKALWGVVLLSSVLTLVFQVTISLHQQTYKSDLVLRFEDTFADKMTRERSEAASAINDYLLQKRNWDAVTNEDNIASMESVLAFFDELGFYWKHGEISGTVLHEHFYSDMRTYCQETLKYIRKEQKKESVADWEYVEPLFNELTSIEAKRIGKNVTNCVWTTQDLQEYLRSEIRQYHAK